MKRFIALLSASLCCIALRAQCADNISRMTESSAISYGQACYFAAVHAGILSGDATYRQAFDTLTVHGCVPKGHILIEEITLEQFAFICAKVWKISGGIFYRLLENPRYALRELKAAGIVPANSDPQKKLSGREALDIISAGMERCQKQGKAGQ